MIKSIFVGFLLLIYAIPCQAGEVRNKVGVAVIKSTKDDNDETKIYYQREETYENNEKLKVRIGLEFKEDEQKTKLEVEYEF